MRHRRRSLRPSIQFVYRCIVGAMILGLGAVPVECSMAAGPHSLFQTPMPLTDDGDWERSQYDDHRGHAGHHSQALEVDHTLSESFGDGHLFVRRTADTETTVSKTSSSQVPNSRVPARQTATVSLASSAMGTTSGGTDLVVPLAGLFGDGFALRELKVVICAQTDDLPSAHLSPPDPPPPKL